MRRFIVLSSCVACLGVLGVVSSGCAGRETTTQTVTWSETVELCKVPDILTTESLVGLFVGIGEFDDPRVFDTPAHGLGAAVFFEPFHHAVSNDPEELDYAVRLLTDLRPPSAENTPLDRNLATALGKLHGFGFGDRRTVRLLSGETWLTFDQQDFVGSEETPPITAERLRASLRALDGLVEHMLSADESSVQVLVYVASHGFLGDDGKSYIRASDSRTGDLSSMVPVSEMIDILGEIVRSRPEAVDERRLHVTLFLDACQNNPSNAAPVDRPDLPPNMVVVESASPGQYAWHWAGYDTWWTEGYEEHRGATDFWSRTTPISRRGLPVESKMSALPITHQRVLDGFQEAAFEQGFYENEADDWGVEAVELASYISFESWIGTIASELSSTLDEIELAGVEPEQTLRITPSAIPYDWVFFYAPDRNRYLTRPELSEEIDP